MENSYTIGKLVGEIRKYARDHYAAMEFDDIDGAIDASNKFAVVAHTIKERTNIPVCRSIIDNRLVNMSNAIGEVIIKKTMSLGDLEHGA
ncbi:hypothetical protein HN903_04140 [archaeon]|jgi:hypothetical protein|nr:hypothetical protein [archaeon]MBT7128920.1 hypothetical protein [archaeon]